MPRRQVALMERRVDITNLPVLAAYDFRKMEQLVRDLTNALDDPATGAGDAPRRAGGKRTAGRKRRCKKRKSGLSGELSEPSESSVEERAAVGGSGGDDSDELAAVGVRRLRSLAAFASTALSLAESDSVNEAISPLRHAGQHRRRKMKRMAVDGVTATDTAR